MLRFFLLASYAVVLKVFESIRNEEEIELSYSEWSRYLTYTYGSVSTNEFLFCKHTYLSVLHDLRPFI